ncbi:hypothetical protein HPB51_012029 [Rhipicephalus microplus]|uniref:Uncharacterized protein n=1 Tax=Rhipicephalus microplus TaxID=6941 RepID=A0A9J6F1T2_RHIMP|nr:hypothetical protein HPB51_012029 [Rhipicephalus microplus]
MYILLASSFAVPAAFTVVLAAYVYPQLFMTALAPRTTKPALSEVLNNCISAATGVGLAHWFVRMVPLARAMVDKSALTVNLPIADYMTAAGVLLAHVLNTLFLAINNGVPVHETSERTVERYILGSRKYTYDVRPLSSVIYTELALLASIHFFVEGFHIGSSVFGTVGLFFSSIASQIAMALVLGVMGLRTGCGVWKTLKMAVLYSSTTPLGIMCGLATEDNAGWMSYMTLAIIVSLMAGCYLAVYMQHIALREINLMSEGKGNRCLFFFTALLFLICLYSMYEL